MKRIGVSVLALLALTVRLEGGSLAVYEGHGGISRDIVAQSSASIGRISNQHVVISASGISGVIVGSATARQAKTGVSPIGPSGFQLSTYSRTEFFNTWTTTAAGPSLALREIGVVHRVTDISGHSGSSGAVNHGISQPHTLPFNDVNNNSNRILASVGDSTAGTVSSRYDAIRYGVGRYGAAPTGSVLSKATNGNTNHNGAIAASSANFESSIARATHMSDGCVAMQASLLPRMACMRL